MKRNSVNIGFWFPTFKQNSALNNIWSLCLAAIFILAVILPSGSYSQTSQPLTVDVDVPFEVRAPWYNREHTEVVDEVLLIGKLHVTTRTWAARPDHVDR